MIKQTKKFDADKATAAAKRSLDFWGTVDGTRLARVGHNEKEMDILGPEKREKSARFA
ncbi:MULTISPECIES: hypothetical protein [Pseudescherichia]|uniref:hypothetical protein n=1 Tax=Pseudescherichia TaxID=2055880 RepID=UPI001EDE8ECB|nr:MULTISPECIES: hypothetical protein [Pseudescherichia]